MSATNELEFLSGGGKAGAEIRAFDWAGSPLGPCSRWPAALKLCIELMLGSQFPQAIVWGDHLITLHNDAFRPILGDKQAAIGRPFNEIWSEAWEIIGPFARDAFRGVATFIEDFPLIVNRRGYDEQAHFTFCYSPIRDEQGNVCGLLDTVVETTEKVRAQQQLRLLNSELAHRLQNTLATVQGIARYTYRSKSSIETGERAFDERIVALGRAHALLTQSSWTATPIHSIVESALAPVSQLMHRIHFEGPDVKLPANDSLTLSLAISELATNALKYGALSNDVGRVTIEWDAPAVARGENFRFRWTERDGPPVEPPTRVGFGTHLIQQVLAKELRARVDCDFSPSGLQVALAARVSELVSY